MGWRNLEPTLQSEVSQKEKNRYCILTHMYMESRRMVLMNLFAGQQRRHKKRGQVVDTVREGEGGTNGESSIETYTSPYNRQPVGICYVTQGTQPSAL